MRYVPKASRHLLPRRWEAVIIRLLEVSGRKHSLELHAINPFDIKFKIYFTSYIQHVYVLFVTHRASHRVSSFRYKITAALTMIKYRNHTGE